jgi:hypothetical protein
MGLPSIPLARWVEMLDEVKLEEFQAAAKAMVEGSSVRVVRGIPGMSGN